MLKVRSISIKANCRHINCTVCIIMFQRGKIKIKRCMIIAISRRGINAECFTIGGESWRAHIYKIQSKDKGLQKKTIIIIL